MTEKWILIEPCNIVWHKIATKHGRIIAYVPKRDNAHLLLSAPDLLDACELFVEAIEIDDAQLLRVACDWAQAAIEKAKGE